jgi:hypothetical protein
VAVFIQPKEIYDIPVLPYFGPYQEWRGHLESGCSVCLVVSDPEDPGEADSLCPVGWSINTRLEQATALQFNTAHWN